MLPARRRPSGLGTLRGVTERTIEVADSPPATADLVVIGGGIVGCATAFFAARAGLRVVVVERRAALGTLTTPASTGAFRLQFDNPEEIALVREAVELFEGFVERTGLDGWNLGLRHGGYLFCSLTDATVERSRQLVERQRAWGLDDVELLTGDEARARWPWLSPDVRGARYRAGDGWLDVKALTIGYATAASNAPAIAGAAGSGGATFLTRAEVTGISVQGDRVVAVETSRGRIATERVLVATGPFTAITAALAGVELAVAPTRRQKLVIPDLPLVPPDAPMTIHEESAAHWRPAMRGCLALYTEAGTEPAPAADPVPIDHDWAFGLLAPASEHGLARVAPFWRDVWNDGAPTAHWFLMAGQYEVTPDRRPYIGSVGPDGFFVNGGYSGHGVMAGAGGSRLAVELVTGDAEASANPFRPDREIAVREHDIL